MKHLFLILALVLSASSAHAIPVAGKAQGTGQPTPISDGSNVQDRNAPTGEKYVIPYGQGFYGAVDEGNYFTAMTATPGTAYALTGSTQTAWVATTPNLFIKNNDSAGAKKIFMDQVAFVFATAGTAGTRVEMAVVLDKGSRTTSAGTALTVYNNTGSAKAQSTLSTGVVAGAVTASAATTPQYLCRRTLKSAIPTVGDTLVINFGPDTATNSQNSATCPPVQIDGQQSLLVYIWLPSQSAAPTGEVQASWFERK